ncbi:MAG TPA: RHS repeat-associated core domain-containing protein [Polyangiaceae bacterium]|nr:RHS repeat-associated core domain-containing protein [Polyangiaceae bacterium]
MVDGTTRHFVADLYQRKFDSSGTTQEERFRLYAGDRQIAELIRKDNADQTLYFHPDHLGSPETISDSNGAAYQQHFDPFGAPLDPPNPELTRVGFTGHDHDRDLGLIDMKGRVYDPLAGRFLTADPVMQAPYWSQGLNRYSYVFNNPINNTDPSGFIADGADYSGVAITGWGAGVTGIAAGIGFSGIGAGALSSVTSAFMPSIGDGVAGSTRSATAPTTVPKGRANPQGGAGAAGENKGGIGELAPPDTVIPDVYRGGEGRVVCYPACSADPDAAFGPNKAAADWYKKGYEIVGNGIVLADGVIGLGRWALGRLGIGAGRAALTVGRTLNATVGEEAAAVTRDVLKGRQPLSALTAEQRAGAAAFYRDVASRTTGKYAETASKFNVARAEFLEGTRSSISSTIQEFMKGL